MNNRFISGQAQSNIQLSLAEGRYCAGAVPFAPASGKSSPSPVFIPFNTFSCAIKC
jgi:hypothetical protein